VRSFSSRSDPRIDAVLTNPLGFPVVFGATRRALVHRFPYGLFFQVAEHELVVFVACFHTRRSPSVVKRRG
jgi:hypothetical protein